MIRTEHREKKWKFPFVMYSANSEKELPLIIQLHGAGERGDGGEALSLVDVHGFSKTVKNDTQHECMIVMPQCPENSFWAAKVESILEFIEQLKSEYNINDKKIYLTGLSMGGFGTWYTSMAKPDIFAAIAPVCGGGMAWNAGVLNMPIWAWHGSEDGVVSPRNSDEMVDSLINNGKNVKYTRVDGVGHNVWDNAYTPELLEWLLDKSL